MNLKEYTIPSENRFSQIKKIYSCSKKTLSSIYLLAPIPLSSFIPTIALNQIKFLLELRTFRLPNTLITHGENFDSK